MNAVRCVGLHAGYRRVVVVRNVNLEIAPGEVVVILGPNGAGKTTTLMTIAGLLPPIGGTLEVLGRRPSRGKPHQLARRGLSTVTDDRALFFSLSVEENLSLGAGPRQSIAEAFELFPALAARRKVLAGMLSGGEQQMLAMARAILQRPKLLLLDEISAGLAPAIVEELLPVVRSTASRTGCAVLAVEQHVHLGLEIADRAIVMVHGEVVLEGSGEELSKRVGELEATYLGTDLRASGRGS